MAALVGRVALGRRQREDCHSEPVTRPSTRASGVEDPVRLLLVVFPPTRLDAAGDRDELGLARYKRRLSTLSQVATVKAYRRSGPPTASAGVLGNLISSTLRW